MLRLSYCCLMLLACTAAVATPVVEPVVRLDTLLVSGEQPGPGMWRVRHGDNVLWILATQSPLPKRMRWRSDEVAARIAESQAVIADASVEFSADIGRLRGLLLVPSLLGARRNPDEQRLVDVLPAALYERWSALRTRYIGRSRSIERWRPIFAAQRLYSKAIAASGLSDDRIVWKEVRKIAKRLRVPLVEPSVAVTIESPKASIEAFSRATLADIDCLERTVERLETDLDAMRARANAWAIGDLEALRELPHPDNAGACRDAVLDAELMQQPALRDLPRRRRDAWVAAVDTALSTHRSSVAVVSLRSLLETDGYLDALIARGYSVEAPE